MTPVAALRSCFRNYATFDGTATRTEFAWLLAVDLAIVVIGSYIGSGPISDVLLAALLVLFIPLVSVTVRRLHDTGRSGALVLLWFLPVIGTVALLVMLLSSGRPRTIGRPVT